MSSYTSEGVGSRSKNRSFTKNVQKNLKSGKANTQRNPSPNQVAPVVKKNGFLPKEKSVGNEILSKT